MFFLGRIPRRERLAGTLALSDGFSGGGGGISSDSQEEDPEKGRGLPCVLPEEMNEAEVDEPADEQVEELIAAQDVGALSCAERALAALLQLAPSAPSDRMLD